MGGSIVCKECPAAQPLGPAYFVKLVIELAEKRKPGTCEPERWNTKLSPGSMTVTSKKLIIPTTKPTIVSQSPATTQNTLQANLQVKWKSTSDQSVDDFGHLRERVGMTDVKNISASSFKRCMWTVALQKRALQNCCSSAADGKNAGHEIDSAPTAVSKSLQPFGVKSNQQ